MPEDTPEKAAEKMFSLAPMPIFNDRSWEFRPIISSPLSSPPVRGSSPLSPIDDNALPQHHTQSSPIPASKFKFASRPTKPNPVVRRREDAQESRRKLFLHNVRNRAEDRAYGRRDIEGTLLRSSWEAETQKRILAKRREGDAVTSEMDIEDAVMMAQMQTESPASNLDDMMADVIAQEEERELDALLLSFSESMEDSLKTQPQEAASLSDDEDYDALFMSLVSEEESGSQELAYSQEMDTC